MTVSVSTIGVFKTLPAALSVSLGEGARFADLIGEVAKEYPEFREILCAEEDRGVVVLQNGRSILLNGGMDAPLAEGDDLFIAPMTYGG
ncbi:MAG: MoaD/ThiS family protein [Oscillibacter sp.]|nr:MoaD/ThiS family protein [Oscillibacter sp.]